YWLILQPVPLGPLAVLPKHYTVTDCWNYSSPRVHGESTLYSDGWYNGYNWHGIAANPGLPAFGITAWPRPWAKFFRVLPEGPYHPFPEGRVPPTWPPPPDLPRPK